MLFGVAIWQAIVALQGRYRGERLFLAAAFPSQTAKNVKRYYTLKVKAVNR